jgi:TPR repeat protein
MKMQISRLRHLRTDASAAKTSSDANPSQPDIQVAPQVQPQDANPATTAANTANGDATGTSAESSANSVSPAASDTMPAANPPQNANAAIGNRPPAGGDTTSAEPSASPADNATALAPAQPDTAATRPTPAKTPGNASVQSRRSRTPAPDDQEVITRKLEPGQDELARANYASDSAAAAAWLWKATAKGNPDAPVRLADMYIEGDGVPRSCDQALVLLKSAASKPNVRARNRLAALYATGICVQRDRIQAFRWLNSALAADPNSDWALQNRDLVWRQMTPQERTLAAKYR